MCAPLFALMVLFNLLSSWSWDWRYHYHELRFAYCDTCNLTFSSLKPGIYWRNTSNIARIKYGFAQLTVIFLLVDNSSSTHVDSRKGILVKKNTKVYNYNESNSVLYVNVVKTYQFKAKDFKIKPYPLCLDNISSFTLDNRKTVEVYGKYMIFLLIIILLTLRLIYIKRMKVVLL